MAPIVAGILALALGAPGLLRAGCPACAVAMAPMGSDFHEGSGPEIHPLCCGSSATAGCCGETTVPETPPGVIEAAAAKKAPASPPLALAPAAMPTLHEATAKPFRLGAGRLRYEGAGLCTLHSVLLI